MTPNTGLEPVPNVSFFTPTILEPNYHQRMGMETPRLGKAGRPDVAQTPTPTTVPLFELRACVNPPKEFHHPWNETARCDVGEYRNTVWFRDP